MQIIVTTRAGTEHALDTPLGYTAMQVIRDSGVDDLLAMCGGCCSCATCHVYVDSNAAGALAPMNQDERDLLDGSNHRKANSRLSCQIAMTRELDGLRLTVAPED